MPMNGNARGDADFAAVAAANPNMGVLTPSETTRMQALFEILFSADTSYIQANADVVPAAHSGENLSSATGQPVSVSDPDDVTIFGATTADMEVVGKGSIL